MLKTKILTLVAIVISLAAVEITANLLDKHISGSSGSSWFEAGCSSNETQPGGANCAKVLASRYSYFPPKPEDPDARDRVPRVPAAFLGLVYYTILAVWFIGIGTPSWDRRWLLALIGIFVAFGLIASAYFTYIMFTELEEWCPWCLASHGLNVVMAVLLFLLRPKRPASRQGAEASEQRDMNASPLPPPHPTRRLILITSAAMLLGCYGQMYRLGTKTWRQNAETLKNQNKQYEAALQRLMADTTKLVRNWELAEEQQFPIRPDETIRTHARPGQFTWDVVVFSDFECPACRRTAKRLEEQVQPLFDGRLRVMYKHYPLNTDCNASTHSNMHRHACTAAAMAEAARLLGGNEAFWRAHDFLFANQHTLKRGKMTAQAVAEQLGFDLDEFRKAMQDEAAARRVWEDVNAGVACPIRATPSVYIKGKHVDNLANKDMDFWAAMANRFWYEAKEPRPPASRPQDLSMPSGKDAQKPPTP
ncbi:MAG: vitamin K epoxide reductase family protein [Phycisphaerae bacterium]